MLPIVCQTQPGSCSFTVLDVNPGDYTLYWGMLMAVPGWGTLSACRVVGRFIELNNQVTALTRCAPPIVLFAAATVAVVVVRARSRD